MQQLESKSIHLTHEDVEAILSRQRSVTVQEIEWCLSHPDDPILQLTTVQQAHLRNLAARMLADRHLAAIRGLRKNDEFLATTVGIFRTPYGDLNREEVEQLETIRTRAMDAIRECDQHQREHCQCWAAARNALYEIRRTTEEKSARSMAAVAVWNSIEAFARTRDRQHPPEAPQSVSPQVQLDITGRAPNPFNWRYWKSPTYQEHIAQS